MRPLHERMGRASALQSAAQSVVAGAAGGLVGTPANGAALPVMGIIAGFTVLAALFLLAAHRRRPETDSTMIPTSQ